ncbi:putative Ig domain-containing protein [Actinoplanes sp. NPDC049118]|uniref:putative Ig domain-containing protein n=1 Tax=Actinoplanes sp. NPDC049118 TaxID=3155769 RepID=UPI003408BC4D
MRPRVRRSSHLKPSAAGDGGFTLIEVLVALAVITMVMTAATPFIIKSVIVVAEQRSQQTAVQLASDAVERVRAIKPEFLLKGRSQQKTDDQWSAAPDKVKPELAKMEKAWDPAALATSGPQAGLPTDPVTVSSAGLSFDQRWYVGRCWQKPVSSAQPGTAVDCKPTPTIGYATYIRVVVSVTWTGRGCAASCVEVTSTLASTGADPSFEVNSQPPVITGPASAFAYVGEEVDENEGVDLQMLSEGGAPGPLAWSVVDSSKLPQGLTLVPESGQFTGTPEVAGSYQIPVKVTDSADESDTFTLPMIVYPEVTITVPGDQTNQVGNSVSRANTAAGGKSPYTWAAQDLPAGLSINSTTGVISGTTTAPGAHFVQVTVADANDRTAEGTISWIVGTPPPGGTLKASPLTPKSVKLNTSVNVTMTAFGGTTPYAWAAQDLPPGLSINSSTGAMTGKPTTCTRYVTNVTVTDKNGEKATTEVIWQMRNCGNARVTSPSPTNPDQTTVLDAVVNLNAKTNMSNNPSPRWNATGLPPGLTMTVSGAVTGSPTKRGTYPVTLTVTNGSKTSVLMFTWTVK